MRCGLRALLCELIFDGRYPWMRVHSECYESKHPQERMIVATDPITLYRPSPESGGPTASVLSVIDIGGPAAQVTWTQATVLDSTIAGYVLYRSVDGMEFAPLQSFPVMRDWDGSILVETLSFDDADVSLGQALAYYVVATDANSRSATSNTDTLVIPGECSLLLEDGGFLLLEDTSHVLLEECD
jgi:hypothetical protein